MLYIALIISLSTATYLAIVAVKRGKDYNRLLERYKNSIDICTMWRRTALKLARDVAERESGVDLMKIYNELTSVCEGEGVENYTNGYRRGHKNGQIELIRKILNISDGVSHEPEQALKGGASK